MNKKARHFFTALVMAAVCPGIALAETPRGAGIVTTLQGQATVTRAIGNQQPVPMKFRDEVFYKDQISVKEHSLARVLLGGKALVTVRELSELTITELPNRPTVLDMLSGKISLAVAKMRMLPGEAIEVRTPNAVAAIRGTTLVVEVVPTSESLRSGKRADMATNVHVLTGKVDVFSPSSPNQVVSVGPGFSVSVAGATMGQLRPTPPTVQFNHGHTPQAAHQQAPDEIKKDMASKEMAKAMITAESFLPNDVEGGKGQDKDKGEKQDKGDAKGVDASDSSDDSGDGKGRDGTKTDAKAAADAAKADAKASSGATKATAETVKADAKASADAAKDAAKAFANAVKADAKATKDAAKASGNNSGSSSSNRGSSSSSGSFSSGSFSSSGGFSGGGAVSSGGSSSGGVASILGSLIGGEKGKKGKKDKD